MLKKDEFWAEDSFADILAWPCFQKFESNNSAYIDLIKIEQEVYHVCKNRTQRH